jgi:hypothetical protein
MGRDKTFPFEKWRFVRYEPEEVREPYQCASRRRPNELRGYLRRRKLRKCSFLHRPIARLDDFIQPVSSRSIPLLDLQLTTLAARDNAIRRSFMIEPPAKLPRSPRRRRRSRWPTSPDGRHAREEPESAPISERQPGIRLTRADSVASIERSSLCTLSTLGRYSGTPVPKGSSGVHRRPSWSHSRHSQTDARLGLPDLGPKAPRR